MALKHLTTEEMISVSTPLVTESSPAHQVLMSIPAAAAIMPQLRRVHERLLDTQKHRITPEQARHIRGKQEIIDVRHDDLMRCLDALLTALHYWATEEKERIRIEQMRAKLLPEGLLGTQRSFAHESGTAELVRSWLDDDDRAFLRATRFATGTMWNVVEEWMVQARDLGHLEQDLTEGKGTLTAADASRARHQWIRVVNTMYSVVELMAGDDPRAQAVVAQIDLAAANAERRYLARRPGGAARAGQEATGAAGDDTAAEDAGAEVEDAAPAGDDAAAGGEAE